MESQRIDNREVYLRLRVIQAEGIDDPYLYPYVDNRDYVVLLWISPGEECHTRIVKGLPNPVWNVSGTIFLKEYPNIHTFLNLEVLRLSSVNDPGTSNGVAIVGRGKIPLPREFNCEKVGCFPLVRADYKEEDYKVEGGITLCIELKRRE
ncbi:hypothetical protein SESBI_14140 [Sesbania bispinosa]|nr:hypothetical protein SESBI_14140 [Sesbania bispinosa]